MAVVIGTSVLFGVHDLKGYTVVGIPSTERVRIRMRNDSFATLFVKGPDGIEKYYFIADHEMKTIQPSYRIAANQTLQKYDLKTRLQELAPQE